MGLRLGVNVDHVATVRQARYRGVEKGFVEPYPLEFALAAQQAGAHGITAHLREDRRHMQEKDIWQLKKEVDLPLNLEMANTPEMVKFALSLRPHYVCLVPENRREVTTEGGLDVIGKRVLLRKTIATLQKANIKVSLFIDPDLKQIEAAALAKTDFIELHTGPFALAYPSAQRRAKELKRLICGAELAQASNLKVNAGHGLNYINLPGLFKVPFLHELNIGHSIVSRALFTGVKAAVKEMAALMKDYRP